MLAVCPGLPQCWQGTAVGCLLLPLRVGMAEFMWKRKMNLTSSVEDCKRFYCVEFPKLSKRIFAIKIIFASIVICDHTIPLNLMIVSSF